MAGEARLENRHGILGTSGGMQGDRIDIGVSCSLGLELGGAAQFGNRLVGSFEAGERKSEGMMQPRFLGRRIDRRAQHAFSLSIPAELARKIGEVDRRRPVLWAQPQRRLVFDLGIRKEAAPRQEISQRGPRLDWPPLSGPGGMLV